MNSQMTQTDNIKMPITKDRKERLSIHSFNLLPGLRLLFSFHGI